MAAQRGHAGASTPISGGFSVSQFQPRAAHHHAFEGFVNANRMHLGNNGKVLGPAAAAVTGSAATAARAATREGGG
jgi:hypothetical protein